MAVLLVTYDPQKVGDKSDTIQAYLESFPFCQFFDWVSLIDTSESVTAVQERLNQLAGGEGAVFVVRLTRDWATSQLGCSDWLASAERTW